MDNAQNDDEISRSSVAVISHGDSVDVLDSSAERLAEIKTGARRKTSRRKGEQRRKGSTRHRGLSRHESIRSDRYRVPKSTRRDSIRSDIGSFFIIRDGLSRESSIRLPETVVFLREGSRKTTTSSVSASRAYVGLTQPAQRVFDEESPEKKKRRRRIVLIVAGVAGGLICASILLVAIMILVSPHIDEIGNVFLYLYILIFVRVGMVQ